MINTKPIHNHQQMWESITTQSDEDIQYSLWFNTIVSKVFLNTLPQKQMSKIMIVEELQEPKEDYIALCVQNRHNNQIKFTISFVKPYLKNLFNQELEQYKSNLNNAVSYASFLEIVVLHELCHLKIMSHGKRFFRELRRLITKYLRNLHDTLDDDTIEQINKKLHYLYSNEVSIYKTYKPSKICQ